MENLNDPRNIIGMASIYADDDEDIDIEELEKSIIDGISIRKKEEKPIDIAKEYDRELEELSKKFNINSFSNNSSSDDNPLDNLSGFTSKPNKSTMSFSLNDNDNNDDKDDDEDNSKDDNREDEDEEDNDRSNNKNTPMHSSWSSSRPLDSQLNQMTNEERKQKHINSVLGNMERNEEDLNYMLAEDEEDEMARIMEQIDLLKSNLESEGVDISRIQDVNQGTSKKEAKSVLKILQIKNDRLRYCDMFEEGILACAFGLENMFDGKKEWFGSQIDLTGWSDTVKVKLRRMRYDTSTFVSEVVKGYAISSGWRILFELLPSLFLYSKDRRLRSNDNLISDDKYKDAIRELGT